MVFVHGAGKTGRDYYVEPLAAVTRVLGFQPPHVSVYYADISNKNWAVGSSEVMAAGRSPLVPETPRMTEFKAAFSQEAQRRPVDPTPAGQLSANALPGQDVARLIADEANQIAGYLFNPLIYNHIQFRIYDGLNNAAQIGDSIVVASHSLGTVVAFDALRALGARYNVSTLITLGSPLAILRQLGTRSSDLEEISYDHVGTWLNFYDTSDPVARALGPVFPLPGYRLRDVFVDVASAAIPSHDYFRNSEVLGEIAKALV